MRKRTEQEIGEEQHGLRKGSGILYGTCELRQLAKRSLKREGNMAPRFEDLEN